MTRLNGSLEGKELLSRGVVCVVGIFTGCSALNVGRMFSLTLVLQTNGAIGHEFL